jgi:hypothetical protein
VGVFGLGGCDKLREARAAPAADGHVAVFDVDPPTALGKKVQLTKTTIRSVHGPGFGESAECAAAAAPAAGNKAEGVPLCPKR